MKQLIFLVFLSFGKLASYAQNGLRGEYYNGVNFDKKVFIRNDAKIDFNWGLNGPKPGIVNSSNYSIKWSGYLLAPVTGKYSFSATVDDGFRVWINNVLVMDSWALHNSSSFKKNVMLTEGKSYPIRIEYFNDMLHGVFKLFWTIPDQDISTIDAKYFNLKDVVKSPVNVAQLPQNKVIADSPSQKKIETPVKPVKKAIEKKDTIRIIEPSNPILGLKDEIDADPQSKVMFFETGSESLTENSKIRIEKLYNYLVNHPTYRIKLFGHTDVIGDKNKNLELSIKRTEIISEYLFQKGIQQIRIDKFGLGSEKPLYPKPASESEHATNRRVEFDFIKQ
jgi:outer membrane protein OmpA-like peptidoglycan-associated protein